MYAAASTSISECVVVVSRYIAQSAAKPSGLQENLFLPNVFKKFPTRIHTVTFGRNGVVRYFRSQGILK